jgi:hypothetical protein
MQCTAEEIDRLFDDGALRRIGMGSRRACYLLPGEGAICLKCYRSDGEIAEGRNPERNNHKALAPAVVREIRNCRFDERRNTCCQEYRYWKKLSERIPAELMAAFPDRMEIIRSRTRGWCLVEELMENDDGTPMVKFHEAWNAADDRMRETLLSLFDRLEDSLAENAVRFFDPQTIMVQTGETGIRLRIPDFEPAVRTLLPLDAVFPALIAMKVRRRFARYRKFRNIRPRSAQSQGAVP